MYTTSELAEALGLLTRNGLPHTALVSSLLKEIEAQPACFDTGNTPMYGHCVLPLLRQRYGQAVHYDLPERVQVRGRTFHVRYWPEEEIFHSTVS